MQVSAPTWFRKFSGFVSQWHQNTTDSGATFHRVASRNHQVRLLQEKKNRGTIGYSFSAFREGNIQSDIISEGSMSNWAASLILLRIFHLADLLLQIAQSDRWSHRGVCQLKLCQHDVTFVAYHAVCRFVQLVPTWSTGEQEGSMPPASPSFQAAWHQNAATALRSATDFFLHHGAASVEDATERFTPSTRCGR